MKPKRTSMTFSINFFIGGLIFQAIGFLGKAAQTRLEYSGLFFATTLFTLIGLILIIPTIRERMFFNRYEGRIKRHIGVATAIVPVRTVRVGGSATFRVKGHFKNRSGETQEIMSPMYSVRRGLFKTLTTDRIRFIVNTAEEAPNRAVVECEIK